MWWLQDQFLGILTIFGMLFSVFFLHFPGIVCKKHIYYLVCLYFTCKVYIKKTQYKPCPRLMYKSETVGSLSETLNFLMENYLL